MKRILLFVCIQFFLLASFAGETINFCKSWKFHLGDAGKGASSSSYNDSQWRILNIPHDWSIEGTYKQFENGTDWQSGFLPAGISWYRKTFTIPSKWKNKKVQILFEGVYLNSEVWINGHWLGKRPNGYISFVYDLTPYLQEGKNQIAVKVDHSKALTGRWYTGSGIYRPVYLLVSNPTHIPYSGIHFRSKLQNKQSATYTLSIEIETQEKKPIKVKTYLQAPNGSIADTSEKIFVPSADSLCFLSGSIRKPLLWSPDSPNVYTLICQLTRDNKILDECRLPVGFRQLEFNPVSGFLLNGKSLKIKGVCDHHTAGAVGAAVPDDLLHYRLKLLKDMGCNAIRTSHNPFSPAFYNLCDTMGIMVLNEGLDGWNQPKAADDYGNYFDEWWQKDMTDFIKRDRNHPSIIMWSIGNEVPTQCSPVGYKVAKFLQDICHREDPTRPVTCGMDQVTCVLANGFAAMIDIPGLNYRTQRYQESYDQLPQNLILGSETASTVSSRGVYKFPVEDKKGAKYEDHQCSSYDVEVCPWSNIPDEDFALADDHHWTIGQFVWTGFDYLGEPSPYDTDSWPNHSSMFGIIDLASLPKDRYYLYRSVWNKEAETLHILPHWTWPGREGEVTPVFVYTNYPTAELFINGKSYGKQSKNNSSLKNRYRLMWMDTKYEPGEVKVVAYDKNGKAVAEKVVRTAGKPHHIELVSNRNELTADGKDLAYVTVKVVDKDGNLCPADNRQINFSVKGTGKYRAAANGDPTNLEQFHLPKMHAFNGMLTAILQAGETVGEIVFTAKANGVKAGNIRIQTK